MTGGYYVKCKPAAVSRPAQDDIAATRRLWDASEALLASALELLSARDASVVGQRRRRAWRGARQLVDRDAVDGADVLVARVDEAAQLGELRHR